MTLSFYERICISFINLSYNLFSYEVEISTENFYSNVFTHFLWGRSDENLPQCHGVLIYRETIEKSGDEASPFPRDSTCKIGLSNPFEKGVDLREYSIFWMVLSSLNPQNSILLKNKHKPFILIRICIMSFQTS
jgi:hypothetical protein